MCVYNMTLQWDCVLIVIAYRLCDGAVPLSKSPLADSDRELMTSVDDNDGKRSYGNTVQNATDCSSDFCE